MATKKDGIDLIMDALSGKGVDIGDVADTLLDSKSSGSSSSKSPLDSILDTFLDNGPKYPIISTKNYKATLKRFQREIPEKLTSQSLASTLDMKKSSVEETVMPDLIKFGLIKKTGAPTALAAKWASEDTYEEACEAMIEAAGYPSTVLRMKYTTKGGQKEMTSWFKKNADVTETVAKKMTSILVLLQEGAHPDASATKKSSSSSSSSSSSTKKSTDKPTTDVAVDTLKSGVKKIKITISVPDGTTKKDVTELLSAAEKKALTKYKP